MVKNKRRNSMNTKLDHDDSDNHKVKKTKKIRTDAKSRNRKPVVVATNTNTQQQQQRSSKCTSSAKHQRRTQQTQKKKKQKKYSDSSSNDDRNKLKHRRKQKNNDDAAAVEETNVNDSILEQLNRQRMKRRQENAAVQVDDTSNAATENNTTTNLGNYRYDATKNAYFKMDNNYSQKVDTKKRSVDDVCAQKAVSSFVQRQMLVCTMLYPKQRYKLLLQQHQTTDSKTTTTAAETYFHDKCKFRDGTIFQNVCTEQQRQQPEANGSAPMQESLPLYMRSFDIDCCDSSTTPQGYRPLIHHVCLPGIGGSYYKTYPSSLQQQQQQQYHFAMPHTFSECVSSVRMLSAASNQTRTTPKWAILKNIHTLDVSRNGRTSRQARRQQLVKIYQETDAGDVRCYSCYSVPSRKNKRSVQYYNLDTIKNSSGFSVVLAGSSSSLAVLDVEQIGCILSENNWTHLSTSSSSSSSASDALCLTGPSDTNNAVLTAGCTIITGHRDGSVSLWDTRVGKCCGGTSSSVQYGPVLSVQSLQLNPTHILTRDYYQTCRMFDIRTITATSNKASSSSRRDPALLFDMSVPGHCNGQKQQQQQPTGCSKGAAMNPSETMVCFPYMDDDAKPYLGCWSTKVHRNNYNNATSNNFTGVDDGTATTPTFSGKFLGRQYLSSLLPDAVSTGGGTQARNYRIDLSEKVTTSNQCFSMWLRSSSTPPHRNNDLSFGSLHRIQIAL